MEGVITPRYLTGLLELWPQDEAGSPVVDTGWFSAGMFVNILAARAALAGHLKKTDPSQISKYMEYTMGCVRLEEERVENCPCAPPSGCTWFAADIPTPIGDITSVAGIGGNLKQLKNYTYRDWKQMKFTLEAIIPAERERGYYTERNNRLFLISKGHEEFVSVAANWYDPVEVQRWPSCNTVDPCKPFMDYNLYIPSEYADAVLKAAFEVMTGMRRIAKFDSKNDGIPK